MGASTSAEMRVGQRSGYLHPEQETLPRELLAQLQLQRLQNTVRSAYDTVPLHRQRFDALGITPQDIRSLDDLDRLPFTVKTDLRDHYPFGMFTRPIEQLATC